MDCSAFRRHHLAYVDDTLPGDLLVAAARHAAECPACARHDTAVRRSLLLARNVCQLECSPDFAARLEARLQAALAEDRAGRGRAAGQHTALPADAWPPSWWETASSQLTTHLAAHRRTRQAVAAAAVLAAMSAGAVLRGEHAAQVQGVSGGAWVAPFASPFAASSSKTFGDAPFSEATFGAAGAASPKSSGGSGGFTSVATEASSGSGATLVAYDGALDAGALVAPAATGVPVWAAAMLAGEVPAALWRSSGASSVELVRAGP